MFTYSKGIDPSTLPGLGWPDWIPAGAGFIDATDIGLIAYLVDTDSDTTWPFLGLADAPSALLAWSEKYGEAGACRAAGKLGELLDARADFPAIARDEQYLHRLMSLTFQCLTGTRAWSFAAKSSRSDVYFVCVRHFDQSVEQHVFSVHLGFAPPPHDERIIKGALANMLTADFIRHPEWFQLYPDPDGATT